MKSVLAVVAVGLALLGLVVAACAPPAAPPASPMPPAPAMPVTNVPAIAVPIPDVNTRIASALSAAPADIAHGAAVLDFPTEAGKPFVELRPGTNGWTCYPDLESTPGDDPLCGDAMWLEWNNAFNEGRKPNITRLGLAYMLQGGSDASMTDPMAMAPPAGQDWITTPPHIMVLSPRKLDPKQFPTHDQTGGPYIMWEGTPYEHIMMPVVATHVEKTTDKAASAMSAAPLDIARDATIVDYAAEAGKPPIELRKGTNGWTCFPDWSATPGNDPQCFDAVWMEWFNTFNAGQEPKNKGLGLAYMLQGGSDASNTDPLAMEPLAGQDWVTTAPHVMILMPDKLDPKAISTDHHFTGPYIMWAGTPYEHIMMPVVASK